MAQALRFAQPAPVAAPQVQVLEKFPAGLTITLNTLRHAYKNGQFAKLSRKPTKNVTYRRFTAAENKWNTQRKGQSNEDFEEERRSVFVNYPITITGADGTQEQLFLRLVGTPEDIQAALEHGISQGKGVPVLPLSQDIIRGVLATQVGLNNYRVPNSQAAANYAAWLEEGKEAAGEATFTAEQFVAMYQLLKGGKVLGAEARGARAAGAGRGRGAKTLAEKYNAKAAESVASGEVFDVSNYKLGGLKVVKWKPALKTVTDPRHAPIYPTIPLVSSDKESLIQAFTELLGPENPELPGIIANINSRYATAVPRQLVSAQATQAVAAPVFQQPQPIAAAAPGTTLRQVNLVPAAGGLLSPRAGTAQVGQVGQVVPGAQAPLQVYGGLPQQRF